MNRKKAMLIYNGNAGQKKMLKKHWVLPYLFFHRL